MPHANNIPASYEETTEAELNEAGNLIWHIFCPTCRETLDKLANGVWAEAIAQKHAAETNHATFVAYVIKSKE